MELQELIKNIPQDLYEDISILAEISFLNGQKYFSESIFPSNMTVFSDEIWDKLRDLRIMFKFVEDRIRFLSLDLQMYLAIERLVKVKDYSVYDIEDIIYDKWAENEEIEEKQYEIFHTIASFNKKRFNKEFLLDNLKRFFKNIDGDNKDTIALDILHQMPGKIYLGDNMCIEGLITACTYVNDSLRYIGIDLYEIIENVPYNNYEIIIKNKYPAKNGFEEYEIQVEKLKENDYILEIFRENGVIEKLNDIYQKIIEIFKNIENNLDEDYYEVLK